MHLLSGYANLNRCLQEVYSYISSNTIYWAANQYAPISWCALINQVRLLTRLYGNLIWSHSLCNAHSPRHTSHPLHTTQATETQSAVGHHHSDEITHRGNPACIHQVDELGKTWPVQLPTWEHTINNWPLFQQKMITGVQFFTIKLMSKQHDYTVGGLS